MTTIFYEFRILIRDQAFTAHQLAGESNVSINRIATGLTLKNMPSNYYFDFQSIIKVEIYDIVRF